ncbi:hypothetical protein VNO80_09986 [Phaseolus coccineus]|uniref:BRCT domain-containing protein n=1 Tax=Phaseolus coccineus TaxID=3886 RepID=A0AAN9N7V6_PHACN
MVKTMIGGVVPQESYKVLPLSGLKICVTGIPAVSVIALAYYRLRCSSLLASCVKVWKVVFVFFCEILYAGIIEYMSSRICYNCLNLVDICVLDYAYAPEGDKYKVAKRWGHIHIVISKWFDQSIARRACLNEEFFPVQHGSVSSHKVTRDLTMQHSQEKDIGKLQSAASSGATDSNVQVFCAEFMERDQEAMPSEYMSSVSQTRGFAKEADVEPPLQASGDLNFDGVVADDSESDDNDLYLSECRIFLVGFEALETQKLINIVRKGGGSRYMSFNDKLTHIVVGNPTEMEKKDVRSLAALGVIYVVKTTWLEDRDHKKIEVPVLRRHITYDLLHPKASLVKGTVTGSTSMDHSKSSSCHQSSHQVDFKIVQPESLEKRKEEIRDMDINGHSFRKANCRTMLQNQLPDSKLSTQRTSQPDFSVQYEKSANIFRGKLFCFSNLFPEEKRGEIVQWISQGGGEVISGKTKQIVHYTVECHGVTPMLTSDSTSLYISSHWIRSCLEELFGEKLTKKVTHLLCKFTNGPKYDGAFKWGIQSVTSEWIFECIKQNRVVATDQFLPKEVTAQDREAGICTGSQFPTQAAQMISDMPLQLSSQSQILKGITNKNVGSGVDNHEANFKKPSVYSKKARLVEEPWLSNTMPLASNSGIHAYEKNFSEDNMIIDAGEVCLTVPDVAAAIEDLLEQTSKDAWSEVPSTDRVSERFLGEDNSNPHLGYLNTGQTEFFVLPFGITWICPLMVKIEVERPILCGRKDDNGEASQDRTMDLVKHRQNLSKMLFKNLKSRDISGDTVTACLFPSAVLMRSSTSLRHRIVTRHKAALDCIKVDVD